MAEKDVTLVPTLLVHQFLAKNGFPQWDSYAEEKSQKLKNMYEKMTNNLLAVEEKKLPKTLIKKKNFLNAPRNKNCIHKVI